MDAEDNLFLFDDGAPRSPTLRPKDAATLILTRREGRSISVLMGQRHGSHAFLPGRLVFPGGGLDVSDHRLGVPTDLRPEVHAKVASGTTPARARALALAAVRETFEETGLLVGEKAKTPNYSRSPAWQRFFDHGVQPRLEALEFVARAITPPGRTRRFDARFFMAGEEQIAHALDIAEASGELLRPVWLTLEEARAADVLPITRRILAEVEARLMAGTDPARPVPFFIPRRGKAVIVWL